MSVKLSSKLITEVFYKSGGRCWYCGKSLTLESRLGIIGPDTFVTDHVVPRIDGGSDSLDNLVPSCWGCNSKKRTYSLEEFRAVVTRQKHHVPRFSDEQIFYLAEEGLFLPKLEPHIFWFEENMP